MVTAEQESVQLRWDAFLERYVDEGHPVSTEACQRLLRQVREHIDAFRRVEWPNLKRQLEHEHGWHVPDELEPHWVAPGRAVYWQAQTKREVVSLPAQNGGRPRREVQWRVTGWAPTLPQPANNASYIAYLLKKGLRLRPPREGVDVEALKAAVPPEALAVPPKPELPKPYHCARHPRARGTFAFATWKGYIQHCNRYRELVEEAPPAEVAEQMHQYRWFCIQHNTGFRNSKMVERHIKQELRRPGKPFHLGVDQMVVALPDGKGG